MTERRRESVAVSIASSFEAAASYLHSSDVDADDQFRSVLVQLCLRVVSGVDKVEKAAQIIADIKITCTDFSSMICDVVSVFWAQKESPELGAFINHLISNGSIPIESAMHLLDVSLQMAADIPGSDKLKKSDVRTRTKNLYTQDKYNLLREESEGFSKLITELHHFQTHSDTDRVDVLWKRIFSLIGFFDLDPNRVLDIILDTVELHPQHSDLVQIISHFQAATVCGLIGFKFKFYARPGISNTSTPQSLFDVTAAMLKRNHFDIDQIWPYLAPDNATLINLQEMADKEHQETIQSMTGSTTDSIEGKPPYGEPIILSFNVPTQKFDLLAAIIASDNWECAQRFIQHLDGISPALYHKVAIALTARVDALLEPAYSRITIYNLCNEQCSTGKAYTTHEFFGLPKKLFMILKVLKSSLRVDIRVFSRLCRVLTRIVGLVKRTADPGKTTLQASCMSFVYRIVESSLMPSFSLFPSSCPTSNDLWALFTEFDYTQRFRLYAYWKNVVYDTDSQMRLVRQQALKATKWFRKRVSSSKIKEIGRQLVRFSHNSPIIVMSLIVEQLQTFDNFIAPTVESLKYLAPMSFDVIVYTLLDQLSHDKNKMQLSGAHNIAWFNNLCTLTGVFYQKFPDVELIAILDFIKYQLTDGDSLYLHLLRELISSMSSVVVLESMSSVQLLSMAGSVRLRSVVFEDTYTDLKLKSRMRKATPLLRKALFDGHLIASLFILTAQAKNAVLFESDERPIGVVCNLFDNCQQAFVYLQHYMSLSEQSADASLLFAKELPSLYDMVIKFHLRPEDAFAICRSVIGVKHIVSSPASQDKRVSTATTTAAATADMQVDEDESMRQHIDVALVDTCKLLVAPKTWHMISPRLFATFWSLSLYDIIVPTEQYVTYTKRVMERNKVKPDSRKSVRDRHKNLEEGLRKDALEQQKHVKMIRERLLAEKDTWFKAKQQDGSFVTFFQVCVLPRLLSTMPDTLFCAKFIHIMLELGTPYFSMGVAYIKSFTYILSTLSSSTTHEASRFGLFISELLLNCKNWSSSKAVFEKQLKVLPGASVSVDNFSGERLDFEAFLALVQDLHTRLTDDLCTLLTAEHPLIVRNSLHFLSKVTYLFPIMRIHGERLAETLLAISDQHGSGSDIQALSIRIKTQIEANQKSWKGPKRSVDLTSCDTSRSTNAMKSALTTTSLSSLSASSVNSTKSINAHSNDGVDAVLLSDNVKTRSMMETTEDVARRRRSQSREDAKNSSKDLEQKVRLERKLNEEKAVKEVALAAAADSGDKERSLTRERGGRNSVRRDERRERELSRDAKRDREIEPIRDHERRHSKERVSSSATVADGTAKRLFSAAFCPDDKVVQEKISRVGTRGSSKVEADDKRINAEFERSRRSQEEREIKRRKNGTARSNRRRG